MASSSSSTAAGPTPPPPPPPPLPTSNTSSNSDYLPPRRNSGLSRSFIEPTGGFGLFAPPPQPPTRAQSPPATSSSSTARGFRAVDSAFALQHPSRPSATSNSATTTTAADGFDVMAQLASQYYAASSRNRAYSAPMPPATAPAVTATWPPAASEEQQQPPLPLDVHIVNTAGAIGSGVPSLRGSFISDLQALHIHTATTHEREPENEPTDVSAEHHSMLAAAATGPLPATFLRTICDQLEFYFCDENLLGDLFLLKNMNMDGYVKIDLLASFGRVKKLTTDLELVKQSLDFSTKLLLNEDATLVCRKEPLAAEQTYHGKLARTAIAYNLPDDASVAALRETFQGCGEISYLRLLKKNTTTGRNAVLKPPIAAGETYAIIEFVDDEMAKHAVLTLSDQYNWRTGMQVVLFDGTNCDKLKQKMFPVELGTSTTPNNGAGSIDRRRAKSASHAVARPVHVEQVGEGLEDLREGKVNTGIVYSIRGAGGLITPTRQDSACISFRLIPDDDGNIDIRQGDYVSFTVGKNKKSGRKYASKVKLEFRPPASLTGNATASASGANSNNTSDVVGQKDYFAPSASRWESGRNRAATVGAQSPQAYRSRSSSTGTRPKLQLSSPRMGSSPPTPSSIGSVGSNSNALSNGPPGLSNNNPLYRQALGPDGTRGFGFRRVGGTEPEVFTERKQTQPIERRRSSSSSAMLQRY